MSSPRQPQQPSAKALVWGIFPDSAPSLLKDLPIFLAAFSVFYAFLAVARYWFTPVSAQAEIDLRPSALPAYAMFSVMRIAICLSHQPDFQCRLRIYRGIQRARPNAS